jgi:hypothetical protein
LKPFDLLNCMAQNILNRGLGLGCQKANTAFQHVTPVQSAQTILNGSPAHPASVDVGQAAMSRPGTSDLRSGLILAIPPTTINYRIDWSVADD